MTTEATGDNNQNLPTGIQERAQNPGQPSNIPSQEVPQNQQQPAQGQPAPPYDPSQNPMLSRQSREPAPVPPTNHLETEREPAPAKAEATGNVKDLVGDLGDDPYAQPSIAYIENVCSTKGVDLERAFDTAIDYGNTDLIDKEYLREKLGDDAEAVIKQATALFEYSASQTDAAMNAVYEAVGGEEVLKQAVPYFNEAADAEERAEVKYLLDSGNKELMARAAKRIVEYANKGGMTYNRGKQPVGSPSTAKGLSKAEYIEAISERNISQEKYEQLREQRKLGTQQGL